MDFKLLLWFFFLNSTIKFDQGNTTENNNIGVTTSKTTNPNNTHG